MFTAALVALALVVAPAQDPPRPRPFPGAPAPPAAEPTQPNQPAEPSTQAAQPSPQGASQGATDADTGIALYPDAVLLGKYEAGPGQPFYVYGSQSAYTNVVEFYRGVLKDRGRQLFGGPMHQFDLGRYRRETMTLQPAVTVKDYLWNGRDGYVHVDGAAATKFPTIIQIVPAPPVR